MKRKILVMILCASLTILVGGFCVSAPAEESQGPWHKVGKEVGETAKAVSEATKETYEKTKEKSSETWQKTKMEGKEALKTGKEDGKGFWNSVKVTVEGWYVEAKKKIHTATAPSDEKQKPARTPDAATPSQ